MANEFTGNPTSAVGMMDRLQADLTAGYLVTARLLPAVVAEVATNANSVQFYAIPAPAIIAAQTEADAWTAKTFTYTARTVTLATYPSYVKVSLGTLNGGEMVSRQLVESMYQDVAFSTDKIICDQISNFTPNVSGATLTQAVFSQGLATLRNQGYSYSNPVAIVSEQMGLSLLQSLTATYIPRKNDEIISNGYVGNVMGVEVFTVPSGILPTVGSDHYGAIFYPNVGIGFGYWPASNGGVIHAQALEVIGGYDIGAFSRCGASYLSATGGVKLQITSA